MVVALPRLYGLVGVENGLHGLRRGLLNQLGLVGLHQPLPGGLIHHTGGRQTAISLERRHRRHGVAAENPVWHHGKQPVVPLGCNPEHGLHALYGSTHKVTWISNHLVTPLCAPSCFPILRSEPGNWVMRVV